MPHHVKRIARTTGAKAVTYAGPAGELVMDITNNDLVLQNGQAGGVRLAKASTVIDATNGVNITTGGTLGATTVVSGVDASTSAKGVVQLSNATDGTSQAMAATPKAVSDALQAAKDYADTAGAPYSGTAPIAVDATNRVISVTDATTAAKGVVQLSNATSGSSQTTAATEKAVADALQAAKDYTDSSMGAKRNIGEIVYSMVPLEDAGMHPLDGSVLPSSGVYAEAVAYITGLQSTYPQLFTTEANWQASVSQYDVCGKFVIGSGTLRLPKVTGHIAGTLDATALGDLVEAGLPNITGIIAGYYRGRNTATSGAIAVGSYTPNYRQTGGTEDGWTNLTFDASRSSPIYGNSTTVQPQAIKGFVYMVVANSIKTPVQVDINRIAADLALKADVDMGNATAAGKAAMAHAAMPSDSHIDLSLPASGSTVVAPADGYYTFGKGVTVAGQYVGLYCTATMTTDSVSTKISDIPRVFLPVKKGDVVAVGYDAQGSTAYFRFIYANGSAPQP